MKKINKILLTAFLAVAAFVFALLGASCAKKPEYTVTFMNGQTVVATVKGHEGDALEAPDAPQEDGYSFVGWSLGESGEIKEFPATIPAEDVTYYANYAKLYEIELNVGDGTLDTQKVYASAGSNLYDALKDVVPTTSDDTYFGAWFYGNKEITAESNTIMPRKDISVRARYKVDYTIKLYKQTEFNVDGYDETPIEQTGSDYVETTLRPTVSYPEDYEYASEAGEKTELKLSKEKEQNVYIYYCRIIGVTLDFDANAPAETEVTGEMDSLYVRKGTEKKIKDCAYTIAGYRFAGWSTKVDGDVEYNPGDTFDGEQDLFLYAVWDKGYTDLRGGVDYIYIDHFDSSKAYLERTGLDEKIGTYDETTRVFSFAKSASSALDGRIALDGETFYYFDDVEGEYDIYDAYTYEKKQGKIKINNHESAVYTNAEGTAVNGTYTLGKQGDYEFTPESGEGFSFQIAKVDKDGTAGCLIRGSEAGMFYFYDSGQASYAVILSLDGYGNVTMLESLTNAYNGTYTLSEVVKDEVRAVIYYAGAYRLFIFRLAALQGYPVFVMSDGMQATLEYTYNDEATGAQKTDVLFIDGYGAATYTPDGGEPIEGSYGVIDSELRYMQFVPKEGEGFKLCYDFETNAYLPIEEHCGSYLFKNGGSLETIMLQLKYNKTATIYVPASDGKTWTPMVNGKYAAAKTPENSFTFTADEDGWIIPEAAYQAKFSAFTFQLGTANKYPVFEMYNADMAGKTITLGKNVYTFAGYNAVTCNLMTQMQDGTESLQLYKGDYRVCTPADGNTFFTYIEIKLSTGVTVLLVDVREDATEGTPEYKEFFGASYTNSYNNPGKYSAQIYPLTDDYMAVAVLDEATGEYKFTFLGTFVNQDKDESTDADNYYEFTATQTAEGTSQEIVEELGSFKCQLWTLSGTRVFLQYDESRVKTAQGTDGSSMEFNAYGLIEYKANAAAEAQTCRYTRLGDLFVLTSFTDGKSYRFHFTNKEETAYAPSDEKEGAYYLYNLSDGTLDTSKILVLAGVSATLYEGETETSGTYAYNEETEDYTFTAADGQKTNFRLTQVTNQQTQQTYPVYCVARPEIVFNLSVVDKDGKEIGSITCDSYGTAAYNDSAEGITYNAGLAWNEAKTVFVVKTYDATGKLLETRYYEVKDETAPNVVWEYGFEKNVYFGYDNGLYLDYALYLDGHGNAEILNLEGEAIENGTYVLTESGTALYTKKGETTAKEYMLFASGSSSSRTYFCTEIDENEGTYHGDDWSVLILDGYEVSATYIDARGVRYSGNYTILKEGYVKFTSSSLSAPLIVTINTQTGKYAPVTEQYILDGSGSKLLAWVDYTQTQITLPVSVTEIGANAFQSMRALVSIAMPGVTSIGAGAFYYCTALETVVADRLTAVGASAFAYCVSLAEISEEKIETIGTQGFYGCVSLTELNLAAIRTIGDYAFLQALTLKNVTIGSAVEKIGKNAFAYANANGEEGTVLTVTFLGTTGPEFGEEIFKEVAALEIVVADEATKTAFAAALEAYAEYIVVASAAAAA